MNLVDFRFLAILLTSFVISCGGGGGGGGGAVSTPLIGYVVDAPVEGLSYSCGGLAGTTGSDGSFLHDSGSACTFKIGNVTIGNFNAAPSDGIVTPHDLAGVSRSDPFNSSAVAIAQFLQSLDDGTGSGRIKIPASVVAALSTVPAQKIVDTTPLSQSQLSSLVSTATNNTKTLVSAATAAAAMNTYIQTTYPNLDTSKGAVAPAVPSGSASAAAPVLTTTLPTTLTATGTSTGFTATSDVNATGYYVVLPATNAAPSKWQIISGTDASSKPVSLAGSIAMTGGAAISNTLSGLAFNTAYKVYFVAVNALQTSKVSDIAVSSVTTLPEPKAPELTESFSNAITQSNHTASISVTSDVTSVGYWVVLPSTSSRPSSTQIITGKDSSGSPFALSGNAAMVAGTAKSFTISGMDYQTAYKLYFVAVNTSDTTKMTSVYSSNVLPEYETPTISNLPASLNQLNHSATLSVTSSVTGTGYWVVFPSSASAPTAAQIVAGKNASNATYDLSGSVALTGGVATSIAINGMAYQTAYKLYFVATNGADSSKVSAIASTNITAELAYELTVVPLKGAIYGATVTAYEANGSTVLASSSTAAKTATAAGKATLLIPVAKASSPIIIQVQGSSTTTYFDEKSAVDAAFPSTAQLVTVMGSLSGASSIGVTPLTTMAAKLTGIDISSLGKAGAAPAGLKSDTAVEGAARLLLALGLPSDFNIFATPALIKSNADLSQSDAYSGLIGMLGSKTAATSSLALFSEIIASTPVAAVAANGTATVAFTDAQKAAVITFSSQVSNAAITFGVFTSVPNFGPTSTELTVSKVAFKAAVAGTAPAPSVAVASPLKPASSTGTSGNGNGSGSSPGSSTGN
jgi:hypothetical protein